LILPAIDLRGGQCVRLRQGGYAQETVFGRGPAAMARRWGAGGGAFFPIVGLGGARGGDPGNGGSICPIRGAAGVPCQLGGGLRSQEHIAEVLAWGVTRVVLGTRALREPDWLGRACARFPGRIVLGIDARDGVAATDGWLQDAEQSALDLARKC